MEKQNRILSDITVHMKYAKYLPEEARRENWGEIVTRYERMMLKRYEGKGIETQILKATQAVRDKKVLPSMRSLQFAGIAIEKNPARIYNCSYLPIDAIEAFSETMFLLLSGTGVGYSVQQHHVANLPAKKTVGKVRQRFLVGDSIEGWADAVKALIKGYLGDSKTMPEFDFRDIREKGERLVTSGGLAPGKVPLVECLNNIEAILSEVSEESRLQPLEVHDIQCHIADAVLAGGIRRAAMICLFDNWDKDMLNCKSGQWWEKNPQRGRANNSAVFLRDKAEKSTFEEFWKIVKESGSGEPGIYWSNDKDWGCNPCCEIGLEPHQFCNLSEINFTSVTGYGDLQHRVNCATILATLQAGFTDFHYLRPIWRETTERGALIGVSMTGLASPNFELYSHKFEKLVELVRNTNRFLSQKIGIKTADRTTCVKPAGTTSLVLGTSSGIHPWHNDYYIRRLRVGKNEAIYSYLKENHPDLIEDELFRPDTTAVISVPQKAPENSMTRHESTLEFLERVSLMNSKWVKGGFRKGENSNNVSATVSVRPDEWKMLGEWMWKNRYNYNGLSVLPFDGGTYQQAPYEDIGEEAYNAMIKSLDVVDITNVRESEDNTDHIDQAACAGGSCEVI